MTHVKKKTFKASLVDFVIATVKYLGEWKVSFDLDKNIIHCSCCKFETFGILCCHCLRVFIHMDVKSVPEQYILKRWTKLARSVSLPNVSVRHVVEDAQLTSTQRHRDIFPRLMRIVDEACRSQETYTLLSKKLLIYWTRKC
uniref:Protein FAR1-RELATED SEQUENCE n=2 Tax=Cajanus cajan TaxID=3821 RepID=A0A151S5B4_CAJCA|nr:Protein FAR-RED IMPAIRED RESPONSE 1 [Cajanus cajan]KYP49931.1 Protein FAR-RED IMPAIRED RESPONSE 1 [Cajanus cajan]